MKLKIGIISLLVILELALAFYLSEWRNIFWDAIATKNFGVFIHQLIIFLFISMAFVFTASTCQYMYALLARQWRGVLNSKALTLTDTKAENFSQRVQEDCRDYPLLAISLGFGSIKAICYILLFSGYIIANYSLNYVIIITIYAIISSIIAKKIAMPLIKLNYLSQVAEASYRQDLTESNYTTATNLVKQIAYKTKLLSYFQTGYGQAGVLVPIIILAPAYFGGAMTLGLLMQVKGLLTDILDNQSYAIYSFDSINRLLSCRKRLTEIGII